LALIESGKPGSICHKKYLALNHEFSEHGLCTASKEYLRIKRDELEKENLPPEVFDSKYEKLLEKTCICVGLGTSGLLVKGLNTKMEGPGVTVCPGPNMAYFSGEYSLQEMISHIYGRIDILKGIKRPNMFVKELDLYIDYLKARLEEAIRPVTAKQKDFFDTFRDNLLEGINYYYNLFSSSGSGFEDSRTVILSQLENARTRLMSCIPVTTA
jgi:hypothetical protein